MTEATAVLITLIAYKAILILIGVFTRGRTRSGEEFFLGGRRLGPMVAAISAAASSSSAWTLLGVSGMAWKSGLSAIWLFPACVGGFMLNWYVLAPALQKLSHRSGALTATDVVAGDRGRDMRNAICWLATIIILASFLTYIASQYQGAAKAFRTYFDISPTASILLGALIVVVYTLLGGFWAVSLTDSLQGLVMAVTSLVLPIAALIHLGGFGELVRGLGGLEGADSYLSLTGDFPLVAGVGFALGLLGIGLGYPGQPHVVNRFMALKGGEHEVKTARRIAITWAVVVYMGMILVGLCGRLIFDQLPEGDKERIFFEVPKRIFHPVVAGVMIAAALSAIMSTADSQLLVAASSITHDLGYGGDSQESLLLRSRIVVVVLSGLAIFSALFGTQDIFNKVLFAWSAVGAAFGPIILVTALRGPVAPKATFVAMALGFVLSAGAYVLRQKGVLGDVPGFADFFAEWGGVLERVLPFAIVLVIALCFVNEGGRRFR